MAYVETKFELFNMLKGRKDLHINELLRGTKGYILSTSNTDYYYKLDNSQISVVE